MTRSQRGSARRRATAPSPGVASARPDRARAPTAVAKDGNAFLRVAGSPNPVPPSAAPVKRRGLCGQPFVDGEPLEQPVERLAGVAPVEGFGGGVVALLEGQQPCGELVEVGEVL